MFTPRTLNAEDEMIPENSRMKYYREETVSVGTEKGFGIVFSIVFAVVACGDIYFAKGLSNSAYFLFSASLFFYSLLTAPRLLRPDKFGSVWLISSCREPVDNGVVFLVR